MNNLYRHEQKYICTASQIKHLFEILKNILPMDIHQKGSYHIKSLYFDTENNRFLQESIDGIHKRSKYRLRRYNDEKNNIKFECKTSLFGLKQKRFLWMDQKEAKMMLCAKSNGTFYDNPLMNEFYCLKKTEGIAPKIIIDYDRAAFFYEKFNIRITLDQQIRASFNLNSFLDDKVYGKNILSSNTGILEVKFNDILPKYIAQILELEDLEQTTFSKYVRGCLAYEEND